MTRFLLDTHIVLWSIIAPSGLSRVARALLEDARAELYVSTVSMWEVAIKRGLRRSDMPDMSVADMIVETEAAGYRLLHMLPEHTVALEGMPARHSDPFNNMLVAQAASSGFRLMTSDRKLAAYGDAVIVV